MSLNAAMDVARTGAAGAPVAIQLAGVLTSPGGGSSPLKSPLIFDANFSSSEISLDGGDGVELRLALASATSQRARHLDEADDGNEEVLIVKEGAPTITISNFRISSPIRVEGSRVIFLSCTFRTFGPGLATAKPALWQSSGMVSILDSAFVNQTGGAIVLMGGFLALAETILRHNSAGKGGAIRVHGGTTVLSRCEFDTNYAATQGGALYVDGGSVQLLNRTFLVGNTAPHGASIYFASGGEISCTLPVPLNTYLFITEAGGDTLSLPVGPVNVPCMRFEPTQHNFTNLSSFSETCPIRSPQVRSVPPPMLTWAPTPPVVGRLPVCVSRRSDWQLIPPNRAVWSVVQCRMPGRLLLLGRRPCPPDLQFW